MEVIKTESIQIKFKNLDRSELAKDIVLERVLSLAEKFEDLKLAKIVVTLEMENSPFQAGPDVFKVKFHVQNGRYKGVTVTKAHSNLYAALADVVEHMLEKLNRCGDKRRVKDRAKARKLSTEQQSPISDGIIFAFAATD